MLQFLIHFRSSRLMYPQDSAVGSFYVAVQLKYFSCFINFKICFKIFKVNNFNNYTVKINVSYKNVLLKDYQYVSRFRNLPEVRKNYQQMCILMKMDQIQFFSCTTIIFLLFTWAMLHTRHARPRTYFHIRTMKKGRIEQKKLELLI